MYEYQYVSVESTGLCNIRLDEYRGVIGRYAAQGWRYAGFLPVLTTGHGAITKIDLIFEKEKEN